MVGMVNIEKVYREKASPATWGELSSSEVRYKHLFVSIARIDIKDLKLPEQIIHAWRSQDELTPQEAVQQLAQVMQELGSS
eukprot:1159729-Pelagomonas_calceolata.AAC.4